MIAGLTLPLSLMVAVAASAAMVVAAVGIVTAHAEPTARGCSAWVDRDGGVAHVNPGCAGLAIDLAGQRLGDPHAAGLASALRALAAEGRSPAALWLSNNAIGDVGSEELAKVLSNAKVW